MTVAVDEILCHLAARSSAPSSMGSQLERLALQSEAKKHGPGWTTHSKPTRPTPKDPSDDILRDAEVFRLIAELGKIRAVDNIETAPTLIDVAAEQGGGIGRTLVRTLRAFQEALRSPTDEELDRANRRAERAQEAHKSDVFQRAIADYRAPRGVEAVQRLFGLKTSERAAELYADSLLVLSLFVQDFNRKKPGGLPAPRTTSKKGAA